MASSSVWRNIDWLLVLVYLMLVGFGLINIYSVEYSLTDTSLFDFSKNSGKQVIWIGVSLVLAVGAMLLDARFYSTFAYYFFGAMMLLLLLTYFVAPEIKGARSWLVIGSLRLGQTSEFAKFATVLAIARFLDGYGVYLDNFRNRVIVLLIILLPVALVILQNDTGTAIVFFALILALFREGFPTAFILLPVYFGAVFIATLLVGPMSMSIGIAVLFILITVFTYLFYRKVKGVLRNVIGLSLLVAILTGGFSFGVNYAFEKFLLPHQQTRINVLLGLEHDPQGAGYNVHQSLITIGSGGLSGKGFLQGTQTRGEFVPEQSTDFIFCTIGEEYGFVGTAVVVLLFLVLLLRLIQLAERQKSRFARIYGYGVVSVIFIHFFLNIAMTLGLFPVIGIPLPFFSYGGSSIMGFTVLLFIFIKLDAGMKYYFT